MATTSASAGPGIEKVAGASGYDWEIGQGDPQAQDPDLDLPIAGAGHPAGRCPRQVQRGRGAVGLERSTTPSAATTSFRPAVGGGGFIGCDVLDQDGIDRIAGLDPLVPPLTTPLADVVGHVGVQGLPDLTGTSVWGDGQHPARRRRQRH